MDAAHLPLWPWHHLANSRRRLWNDKNNALNRIRLKFVNFSLVDYREMPEEIVKQLLEAATVAWCYFFLPSIFLASQGPFLAIPLFYLCDDAYCQIYCLYGGS